MVKPLVLVLFGPTASGKTALLQDLSQCGGFPPLEIISADSMQVYRGMDIGTAKPSLEERQRIPHHLIDIKDPNEQFNAGEFVGLAETACHEIINRGSLPVVSGGTGFFIQNLVQGLSAAPPSDPVIRETLFAELSQKGAGPLMEELARADPVSADRIHPNDHYRLIRALEVFRQSGRPLSSFPSPWNNVQAPAERPFRFLLIGLEREREDLYERINHRCAEMFRRGLPEEAARLLARGYEPGLGGLRAIGYNEFFVKDDQDQWAISRDSEGVQALVAQNSRRYAKRQVTYFKALKGVHWVKMGEGREVEALEQVRELIGGELEC
ncbi:MAG: tRNA (adenosine(37)-N6)-dimethylallyltransferase MiaA [Treponema sp.]|nr:tRNA (adenosine(37)-N6)-dimethylallyltransferase MiaA [Treponema sp.]